LRRENRLYQADWLIRFYGFSAAELLPDGGRRQLDLAVDPKLAWALAHRERFPVDVNRAPKESLLRVPGLGVRNVERILAARRRRQLRYDDLARLRCDLAKARPFIVTPDWRPLADAPSETLHRQASAAAPRQLPLFA
jgi:predicted DNA-binding helix-hairpin-helix protein